MKTIEGFIATNGIRIHFERMGGNKPAFLLCHGITDNGRCMLRLARHLETRYDVILVDARGHGRSDSPDSGYSSDDHADDLVGLIQGLGLENPILYGHSMGARTVARVAAEYPKIPRAIIMEDPVYIIPPTEKEIANLQIWLQQMPLEVVKWGKMSFDEHLENARQQDHADWTDDEQIEWAKSKSQVSPLVFDIGKTMQAIRSDFPRIGCPALILKADAEPPIRAANQKAAALIPNCQISHIPGAGHNVRRENWSATISHLDAFLESL